MGFKAKKTPILNVQVALLQNAAPFCSLFPAISLQVVFTRERREKGDDEG